MNCGLDITDREEGIGSQKYISNRKGKTLIKMSTKCRGYLIFSIEQAAGDSSLRQNTTCPVYVLDVLQHHSKISNQDVSSVCSTAC